MRRVLLCLLVMVCCVGQTCAPAVPTSDLTSQGDSSQRDSSASICDTTYYNEEFRFGFNPIFYSAGPTPVANDPQFDLSLNWVTQIGSIIDIAARIMTIEGGITLEEARQAQLLAHSWTDSEIRVDEILSSTGGNGILQNNSVWHYVAYSPSYALYTEGVVATRGEQMIHLYATFDEYLTMDELYAIEDSLFSLCVND